MTKRGMIAIAVMLVAMLVVAAPAAMAQLPPLTAKQAKKLAKDLGEKQQRENRVIVYHVEDMKRVDAYTFKFSYDERTEFKTFCTAVLRVTKRQSGNQIAVTAKLTRHKCAPVPADALATERVARKADRRVRRNEAETTRSVRPVLRGIDRCRVIRDAPRKRRAAVAGVIDSAVLHALLAPNADAVGAFVANLTEVDTNRRVLVRAIAGWTDWLDVARSLPEFPRPCRTLETWADADWAAGESPIDMSEYRALVRRGRADEKAIASGARFLLRAGVFRKAVLAFTPDGLLTRFAQ